MWPYIAFHSSSKMSSYLLAENNFVLHYVVSSVLVCLYEYKSNRFDVTLTVRYVTAMFRVV